MVINPDLREREIVATGEINSERDARNGAGR